MRHYPPTGKLKRHQPSPIPYVLLAIGISILCFFAINEVLPLWP